MKKAFRPLIAAAVLILTLTGCGNVTAGTPSPSLEAIHQTQRTEMEMSIQENTVLPAGLYWEESPLAVYEPRRGGVWYPRLFVTRAGAMLCAFDTNEDGGRAAIKLLTSTDKGLTWSGKITVTDWKDLDCANAAFAELPDGTLLLACRANAQQGDKYYSSIRVCQSRDGGQTWAPHSTIAEELGEGGVYEPHFSWIGDTLAVFYANDSLNVVQERSQQNIEFRLWQDGAWSEKRIASDGTQTRSRDGMPVWTKRSDGRYALVMEATNVSGYPFVIQMKTSPDGLDWSEPNRNIYIPYAQTKKAGAPYILTLPDGRLCVSFQTDDEAGETGDGASFMKVMTSTDPGNAGDSFTVPFIPFLMPQGRSANWNGLYVYENFLYAVTSANSPRSGIYLRRASLTSRTLPGQNVVSNGMFQYKNTQCWTIEQNGKTYHAGFAAKQFENNAGNYALTLINNKQADLSFWQEVPGVQAGEYVFRMKVAGDGLHEVRLALAQGSQTIEASCVPGSGGLDWEVTKIRLADGPVRLSIRQTAGLRMMELDDIQLVYESAGGAAQ